ncbi:sulfotransferase family protein [Burkholderia pseudomultivorans]|uniref:Lipopolysaccharide biosynthesis protein-like protein n=1 Tax=Burkholderia pseudomultivorans TaxID=1207504 RepID=A0ABU2EFH8_9BURK|nr:hypothetical protein [Burkholderia pseudomultivorans]MDR8732328.1 hypothetical protein [Burkholderia pseudomultivorans]MDR8739125.1 hypothetical protein [Burkholderia pseudomultivorans]MDR8742261.1 hypothetical protein [Burkholderia pseudomultivorans]MDR8758283.1 hypothetical protein [Burkholderia pseudomultivorans]MDR8782032.1 hypothetical protein [Burkholderia pseudomultivorans]
MEFKPDVDPSHEATLVVVLGMHRSGTSVVTRAMETMGAVFGDNLMPAVPGVNDKGFFEDLDIYAINQEILSLAGADWHSLALIDLDRIDEASLLTIRERAIRLLEKKCENKIFALKDPRISRLFPFWKPVFDSLGVRVVYALAIRNPMSVERSLGKRDNFSPEKSFLLWLMHTLPPLEDTKGMQRVLVNYDKLMEDPRNELTRMSALIGLPLDARRVRAFEEEFLDGNLRHTRFESSELSSANSAEQHVKALFDALESTTEIDGPAFARRVGPIIDDARRYLEDLAPILQLEWQLEREIARLNAEVSGCRNEAAAQQQQIDGQASELSDWKARAEAAAAVGDSLRAELEGAKKELGSLAEIAASRDAEIQSREGIIAAHETALAAQRTALERAERTIDEILRSKSWRITKPLRFLVRLAAGRK